MGVLFMDSVAGGDGASRWAHTYAISSIESGVSPSGGNAYRINSSAAGVGLRRGIPATTSLFIGVHMRWASLAGHDNFADTMQLSVYGDNGATQHLSVNVTSTGNLNVRRGDGNDPLIASTTGMPIVVNTWHFVEARFVIDDTNGIVQVWVDGTQVLDFLGDTKNAGTNTTIDSVLLGRGRGSNLDFADIHFHDGTTPLGPCRPVFLLPTGAGANTDLTPNTGTNWEAVDEATPDGDTTYVSSQIEGDIDTYQLADLPAGDFDVLAIQTIASARRDDTGPKYFRPSLRVGATNYPGTSQSLSASYATYMEVFDENPATVAPWVDTEINALNAGPEVRDS